MSDLGDELTAYRKNLQIELAHNRRKNTREIIIQKQLKKKKGKQKKSKVLASALNKLMEKSTLKRSPMLLAEYQSQTNLK